MGGGVTIYIYLRFFFLKVKNKWISISGVSPPKIDDLYIPPPSLHVCALQPTHEPEVGTAEIVAMVVRGAVGGIQPLVGQDFSIQPFFPKGMVYISDSIFLTVFFEYDGIPRGQK